MWCTQAATNESVAWMSGWPAAFRPERRESSRTARRLDQPTSALDAEAEHALLERFAEQARVASGAGRVTVLVSHRFATVRMADLIVVLSGSQVIEVGTHDEPDEVPLRSHDPVAVAAAAAVAMRLTSRAQCWGG